MKARSFLISSSKVAVEPYFRIMTGFGKAVSLSSLVVLAAIAVAAQTGPCSCKDKADLLNQLYRANAADNSAQFLQQAMGSTTRRVAEVLDGPNPEHMNYMEMIDREIAEDVGGANDSKAGTIVIKTTDCNPTVSASSACLKSLGEKIAPAHKSSCEKKRAGMGDGTLTVSRYLDILRTLYAAEIAEILKLLGALPKECKPYDWIGLITYNETTMQFITLQDTPTVTEKSEDVITRTGVIKLNGDPRPLSTWEAGGKYVMTKTGKSWRYCTATDRRNDKRTKYETFFRIKWENTGKEAKITEVIIDEPEGGTVLVSFRVPPITVSQKGETTDVLTGGCPNDPINNIIPINNDVVFDSSPVTAAANYVKADPETLSGTDTKLIPNGGAIKVTFNLYRGNPLRK